MGNQFDLFESDPSDDQLATPIVYRADPDRIRRRIATMLAEARAAQSMPWSAEELGNRLHLIQRMGTFLPEDEAAQLAFEFDQEIERLKAA